VDTRPHPYLTTMWARFVERMRIYQHT